MGEILDAIESGDLSKVKEVAAGLSNIDQMDSGRGGTLLTFGVKYAPVEVVEFLLDEGAAIDQQDASPTPLGSAVSCGRPEIVALLLARGASLDIADHYGNPPLHDAMNIFNDDIPKDDTSIAKMLLDAGADVDGEGMDGETALAFAARKSKLAHVELLIAGGADVNKASRNGKTPLFEAAEAGDSEIVRVLLEAGAEVNATVGQTALHAAAKSGVSSSVELLIKAGADVHAIDQNRCLPIVGWLQSKGPKDRNAEILQLFASRMDVERVAGTQFGGVVIDLIEEHKTADE